MVSWSMKTSLKSSVKSAPLISPSLLPLCADVFLNSALDWKLPLTICDLCAYALVGKAALWDALLVHISCLWAISICEAHLLVYPTKKIVTPEQGGSFCAGLTLLTRNCADHTVGEELKVDVAGFFRQAKASCHTLDSTNLEEELQQQPRGASSQKTWAHVLCAMFFQYSWILSSPCKEFLFGDHIPYRSCLLSSGWAKPVL